MTKFLVSLLWSLRLKRKRLNGGSTLNKKLVMLWWLGSKRVEEADVWCFISMVNMTRSWRQISHVTVVTIWIMLIDMARSPFCGVTSFSQLGY